MPGPNRHILLLNANRTEADTPLAAWCAATGTSILQVCRATGADYKTTYSWVKGLRLPGLVYAFKIEQATKGGVPVASWLGTHLGKLQWEHQKSDLKRWDRQRKEESQRNNARQKRERRARAEQATPETPPEEPKP